MIIGLDASRATSQTPTGTENYSRELIRALLALDRKNDYRLYTRDDTPRDFFGSTSNFEIRAIPFPRLWTHLRLSSEMLTHPPDVLFVPAHVLPLIHPRRSIVTVHDLGQVHFPQAHPPLQRFYHNVSVWWNVRAAAHILTDSEATRDDLVKSFRAPIEKITVVYLAHDAKLYQRVCDAAVIAETKARIRVAQDYVLAIGTVHPRKNYARLIEAFGKLQNANCELVIVGKRGWLYDSIFARVKELNLEARVKFLDYVPMADMPSLISGARLLAFPSLYEGFGLPVLEAQACGTPVVCSMTSSLPEAAGDAALFFDPLDVDAIAGAMQRVLTDETVRAKLILRGYDNVKRFAWQVSARRVLDIIEGMR